MKLTSPLLLAQETALVLLRFPLWWYGPATSRQFQMLKKTVLDNRRLLQVKLLLKHLFDPLYGGDGSREMHVISVAVRIPYTLVIILWTLGLAVSLVLLLALWIAAPVVVAAALGLQLNLISPEFFRLFGLSIP